MLLICSIIGMSFSKKIESHEETNSNSYYVVSIICILLASTFWGSLIIICWLVKNKFPESSTEDFSYLMTFFSGLSGVLIGLPFFKTIIWGSIRDFCFANLAGFLSGIGILSMFRAVHAGNLNSTQVLANSSSVI